MHSIEFRTDYVHARLLDSINDGVPDISNDDLPYYLDGYYCEQCKGFVSVEDKE